MLNFRTFIPIEEGKNDPAIFHVIFMAGGPGSGKSWISKNLGLHALGYVEINSDSAFELGIKKSLLDLKMPASEKFPRDIVRDLAKKTAMAKKGHAIQGRLGMVIDGTGRDFSKIKRIKKQLDLLGYESVMVFVNTSLDIAIDRDDKRPRSIGEKGVMKMWKEVQKHVGSYKKLFGRNKYFIIDNSNPELTMNQINKVYTKIMSWSKTLPSNPAVKNWMDKQ